MVCLRNICVNTLHKGDSDDNNNNNNNVRVSAKCSFEHAVCTKNTPRAEPAAMRPSTEPLATNPRRRDGPTLARLSTALPLAAGKWLRASGLLDCDRAGAMIVPATEGDVARNQADTTRDKYLEHYHVKIIFHEQIYRPHVHRL
jgi:hypothetical protein